MKITVSMFQIAGVILYILWACGKVAIIGVGGVLVWAIPLFIDVILKFILAGTKNAG